MPRIIVRCALVAVLAMSGAFTEGKLFATAGDANGDFAVDVLDLQFVVAQVFSSAVEDPRADVNADGRVDVLDVQCILNQARGAEPTERSSHGHGAGEAIAVQRGRLPGIITVLKRIETAQDEQGEKSEVRRVCFVPLEVYSSRTERYVYCLIPNAPPERA